MKTSIATVSLSVALYAVTLLGTRHTPLGKRIRAVASNPFLAELTRLQPRRTYAVVMALASGLVAVPGMLVAFDLGLQPYTGTTVLLTGTVAVIAGGGGSVPGVDRVDRAAEFVAAGHAGPMERRHYLPDLRWLHARPAARPIRDGIGMEYLYYYLILAAIFVILGLSTNLLVGIAGIF